MNTAIVKKSVSFALALVMVLGTMFVSNIGFAGIVSAETTEPEVEAVSYWTGNAADTYKEGSGTKNSPYIIETVDQLYKMVTSSGKLSGGEAAYYKVADGVTDFYLNDADTLGEIKALVAQGDYKNWDSKGTEFFGNFDGNGVTVRGMVSIKTKGFVAKLRGKAVIENVNFDSCYANEDDDTAIVTTYAGYWNNEPDDGVVKISNVSVRNSYIKSERNTAVGESHNPTAGGIVAIGWAPRSLEITNCLFDGYSSELLQGSNSTSNATGGIISCSWQMNAITLKNCVSLGAPISSQSQGTNYINYNNTDKNFFVYDCYSDIAETAKSTGAQQIMKKAKYVENDLSALDWGNQWKLVTTTDGVDKFDGAVERTIPMPITRFEEAEQPGQQDPIISGGETPEYPAPDVTPTPIDRTPYVNQIISQSIGEGAQSVIGGSYYKGEYGMYDKLTGSGTEQDPYLITTPFELARAIASGGVNVDNRLYYKLACDIDAGNVEWIRQGTATNSSFNKYVYTAFGGILDGDGHTVSGISITRSDEVGLIPVLAADGVVKNLHLRGSNIKSTASYAGAIAGKVEAGGSVIGCSVENTVVNSAKSGSFIVGQNENGAVKNSYYTTADNSVYYNTDGAIGDIDVSQNNDIWYCGGKEGSIPKLKNYAVARKFADIDGDGIADEYTALDLVALKKGILELPDYENIYGDVNRDGIINIADLAILSRSIVGSYDKLYDGFWRNAALGKINIYYGENDNYDAARKLEIYLEDQLGGVDIKKYVSAKSTVSGENSDKDAVYVHQYDGHQKPKGSLEIIVGNLFNYDDYKNDKIGINDYSITYDDRKCVLWLNGGSFTGVEQAVLDFIAKSDEKTGKVYTVDKATLSPEKQPKQVEIDSDYDGVLDTTKTFYYAWGDEFDGFKTHETDDEPLLSQDNWMVIDFNSETKSGGYKSDSFYNNVEAVNEKEISKLYQITDGVLSIKRGVVSSKANAATDLMGYARLDNQTPGTTNALGSGDMYTDLLIDNGTGGQHDKVTLDIDYIRVYQQDGRRDIITPETEDFNNGNHFGY